VLRRLIGGGPVEIGKSILLVVLALLTAISLQQLAATRSGQVSGLGDRTAVLGLARDFGQALTTYDYAHPNVQQQRLAALATSAVVTKATRSFPELRLYQAVSVGDTPDTWLQSLDGGRAEVLVMTRSTVRSSTIESGTRASGLLLCDLRRQGSGAWRVADYRWLTPATQGVS
jgi:ABC-type arginine transport system ATPase subunit